MGLHGYKNNNKGSYTNIIRDYTINIGTYHYGGPIEIVLDGGVKFTSHMIERLMQKYGIKHCHISVSSPGERSSEKKKVL